MISLKKYPVLLCAFAICGLAAVGEGWLIYDRIRASREAAATLAKKQVELNAMAALVPGPTRAVAAAIEADLARARRALDTMQGELKGRGPAAERIRTAKVPTARTEAYFDLATFVEKSRDLAKAQNVDLRPEANRFGFALYANEGPKAERIAPVFHQQLIAQYLVESLLEARPRVILSIKREPTLTKAEKDKRDADLAAAAGGAAPAADPGTPPDAPEGDSDSPDFFTIDSHASARVPGYLDATAFRLTFVGQTTALRAFLNKLASFELPVLVREVEVEAASASDLVIEPPPVSSDDSANPGPSPEASVVLSADSAAGASKSTAKAASKVPNATPIVAKPWCKFTVTVEYVELVPPAGAVAGAAADPAKPAT